MQSDAYMFMAILMFFAMWTGIVGIENMAAAGAISMDDLSQLTGPIPGQTVANIGSGQQIAFAQNRTVTATEQDYTNSTGFTTDLTSTNKDIFGVDYWQQYDGIGFKCVNEPLPLINTPAALLISGLQPINGVYQTTYYLNNPTTYDLYLPLYSFPTTQGEFIRLAPEGVYRSFHTTAFITKGYVAYSNAHKAQKVQIWYDATSNTGRVWLDDIEVTTFSNIENPSVFASTQDISYSGVVTFHKNQVVQKIVGSYSRVLSNDSGDWIKAILDTLAMVWNAILMFFAMVGAVIGLSSSPAVPFGVWAIVGLPCVATMIYLGVKVARGGG